MNIFFFGDSICSGQLIPPHKNFVSLISKSLEDDFPNKKIIIFNPSISGNTTRMALERMPLDVQSYKIDIIFIEFGLNDCNYWKSDKGLSRVTKQSFEANLQEIILRARTFGAKKIILNVNHPTNKRIFFMDTFFMDIFHQNLNIEYNQIIKSIAEKENCYINDMGAVFSTRIDTLLLADGIHLNEAGHKVYAESLYPIIKNCINSIKG